MKWSVYKFSCFLKFRRVIHIQFRGFSDPEVDGRINFRQFAKVLAHFRPLSKSKPNTVNSRQEKLKCMLFFTIL